MSAQSGAISPGLGCHRCACPQPCLWSGFLGEPQSYVVGTLSLTPSPDGLQTTLCLASSLSLAPSPFDASWAPGGMQDLVLPGAVSEPCYQSLSQPPMFSPCWTVPHWWGHNLCGITLSSWLVPLMMQPPLAARWHSIWNETFLF